MRNAPHDDGPVGNAFSIDFAPEMGGGTITDYTGCWRDLGGRTATERGNKRRIAEKDRKEA